MLSDPDIAHALAVLGLVVVTVAALALVAAVGVALDAAFTHAAARWRNRRTREGTE